MDYENLRTLMESTGGSQIAKQAATKLLKSELYDLSLVQKEV